MCYIIYRHAGLCGRKMSNDVSLKKEKYMNLNNEKYIIFKMKNKAFISLCYNII